MLKLARYALLRCDRHRGPMAGNNIRPKRDETYIVATAKRYKQEVPWTDPTAVEISFRINLCFNNQREAVARLYDVLQVERHRGRFTVLRQIYFAEDGRKTPAEIAQELRVTSANITYLVKGLEEDGLVRRVAVESDKRTRRIELTEAGLEFCRQIVPSMPELYGEFCEGFSNEEKAQFNDLLIRYSNNAARVPGPSKYPPKPTT